MAIHEMGDGYSRAIHPRKGACKLFVGGDRLLYKVD